MRKIRLSFALLAVLIAQPVWADKQVFNPWQEASSTYAARVSSTVSNSERNVLVTEGRRLSADLESFSIAFTGKDDFLVTLPLPDGGQANYQFSRSDVMADALAEKYPAIQTFAARDTTNPANKGSFDLTPHGFHGAFKHDGKWVYIDPEMRDDTGSYVAYFKKNALPISARAADTVLTPPVSRDPTLSRVESIDASRSVAGETLRTFRLAVSASAEYTAFHGGTVQGGLAAIVTMVNRLNEVFQRELSVRFQLVANNDEIIYTNQFLDPFDNTYEDIDENAGVLNGIIGVNNYDIGHVVNTAAGGIAGLSVICDDDYKAEGATGITSPTGDPFYIDFVAHEIGHQLGAVHTFNGLSGNCGVRGNRFASSAWEPGSGSTIMAYAGTCGSQNLQSSSDDLFHSGSIGEMLSTLSYVNCGTTSRVTNTVPTVDAGNDYVIPANTPFKLVGSAEDVNGDSLSFSWDQYDLGSAASSLSDMVDNGNRPLFRSWGLVDTAERYFPRLEDVLVAEGYTSVGEAYPTTDRDLTLRLTVRDGEGGVAMDETIITVEESAGPFRVTQPEVGSVWTEGEVAVIRWDVANTNGSPVNCSRVDILLSTNSGIDFDQILASSTANDGAFEYIVGSFMSSNARVMVRCSDNVFFAVNQGGFGLNRLPDDSTVGTGSTESTGNKSGGGSGFFPLISVLFLLSSATRKYQTRSSFT